MEYHLYINAGIDFDKETLLFHFFIVFTSPINLWPERYHCFNAHLMKFLHHLLRLWEIFWVKPPVPTAWPVVIIYYYYINRNLPFFVFACNLKNLLLVIITQFALPEAKAIFRHYRHSSSAGCIVFVNFSRSVPGGNPVVHLLSGISAPFSCI